ncbi:MAG: radical SAM protein [Clostridiales bacterium]|jgi:MoaA/NifB/PqqE/SkfB family radical SAM enzyme|nr:radical SAM protein [Clostridiales bacterium]
MIIIRDIIRKRKTWREGVTHVTLDPDGPGVARLHLVPPKPSIFRDPPSLLVINGTWFLPIGPSWATIMRIFFNELQDCCKDKREVRPEEIKHIERAVVSKARKLYPGIKEDTIINDLSEIITLAINIARGENIPKEAGLGFNMNQYSKYMTAPHRMDLIVAPMSINENRICPLNCVCCYADSGQLMDIKRPLSTEEWKKIIDKCRDARIPMVTFTGGEPLTRPDIVELIEYARWFVTRLNTNGYLITPRLASCLYNASLDGIQITLYSHDARIHDSLVGKSGAWEKTVAGIKYSLEAGLCVSINTPLVEKNSDYGNTLRFIKELGVCYVTCSSLIPTGGAKEQIITGKVLDSIALKEVLNEAVSICNELDLEISFTSPGWLKEDDIIDIGLPSSPICGACLSNMAVAPSGDVVPCQSWLNGQTLGNILTNSWKDIWENPQSKKIRKDNANKSKCGLKEDLEF